MSPVYTRTDPSLNQLLTNHSYTRHVNEAGITQVPLTDAVAIYDAEFVSYLV